MSSNELTVFNKNCSKLCDTLTDIENLLPHFVEDNVIKFEDLDEINAIVPSTKKHKVQKLMVHISGPLRAGNTEVFYIMLRIMKEYGHHATQQLAEQIRRSLPISNRSVNSIVGDHINVQNKFPSNVDQDGKTNVAEMSVQGFPILYTLAACHPPFAYYTGHHLPCDYSSQHTTYLPRQTEQNSHTTMEELEDIEDMDITDNTEQNTHMEELGDVDTDITDNQQQHKETSTTSVTQNLPQQQSSTNLTTQIPPSVTKSHIDSVSIRYSRLFRPQKKCSALLIGTGRCVQHKSAIPRRPLDRQSKSPLDGVLKDLSCMNIFMNDRDIPVYDVMSGNRYVKQDKSDILAVFKSFFSQQDTKRFVMYYSGHGSDGTCNSSKGDWCLETVSDCGIIYIGLSDILNLWDEMRAHCGADSCELEDRYLLFIIADCCYSGSWVEEIKAKRPYKKTPSGENYRDVHMIASCQSDELCYYSLTYGGDFTRRYITADSSKHNLNDTVTHLAKLAAQSVIQGVTFPLYMPVKGLANYYNTRAHNHTPVATNEKEEYRYLLMKYDGEILPIGRGLGIASGWSWMLSGQIFHN